MTSQPDEWCLFGSLVLGVPLRSDALITVMQLFFRVKRPPVCGTGLSGQAQGMSVAGPQ